MSKFKVGDIVEVVENRVNADSYLNLRGSVGIVLEIVIGDAHIQAKVNWLVCSDWEWAKERRRDHPECDAHMNVNNFKVIGAMETSNAPESQIPPPSPASSPALDKRTSSSEGSPSQPSSQRASVRLGK